MLFPLLCGVDVRSGAGTIFQQVSQDQPFPAGGLGGAVRTQRGPGRAPEASGFGQQSFENQLKIRSLGRRKDRQC